VDGVDVLDPFVDDLSYYRATAGDFARHLNIAQGSVGEVDYCLLLARDLHYATEEHIAPLRAELDEIGAMLHALRRKIEQERR
jgi:four helix bundle protein